MDVVLHPWAPGDQSLLAALNGDPAMMEHLGGPDSPEKIAERQRRFERAGSDQFKIVVGPLREGVGWVGLFERAGQPD